MPAALGRVGRLRQHEPGPAYPDQRDVEVDDVERREAQPVAGIVKQRGAPVSVEAYRRSQAAALPARGRTARPADSTVTS